MQALIHVCSLTEAAETAANFDAVITIEDVDFVDGLRLPANQLVLLFDDVDVADKYGPQKERVRAALEFARQHIGCRLLVHCKAGQARSPAILLAIIADRLGPGREADAVAELLIGPNSRRVSAVRAEPRGVADRG